MSGSQRVEISRSSNYLIPASKSCLILPSIPLASGRPAATSFALCRRQNLPSGEVLGKKALSAMREWPRRDSRAWGSRVQPWSGGRSVRVRACYRSQPIAESGCLRAVAPDSLPSYPLTRKPGVPETASVSFLFSRLKPSRDTALFFKSGDACVVRRFGMPRNMRNVL